MQSSLYNGSYGYESIVSSLVQLKKGGNLEYGSLLVFHSYLSTAQHSTARWLCEHACARAFVFQIGNWQFDCSYRTFTHTIFWFAIFQQRLWKVFVIKSNVCHLCLVHFLLDFSQQQKHILHKHNFRSLSRLQWHLYTRFVCSIYHFSSFLPPTHANFNQHENDFW